MLCLASDALLGNCNESKPWANIATKLYRILVDLFHMRTQSLFHTEKLETSIFLAFEIASNLMKCSVKHLSVQQLCKDLPFWRSKFSLIWSHAVPASVLCSNVKRVCYHLVHLKSGKVKLFLKSRLFKGRAWKWVSASFSDWRYALRYNFRGFWLVIGSVNLWWILIYCVSYCITR